MPTNYKRLTLVFFIFAVILRVLLFLINPPHNAFDNHFEPILLTMNNGSIPAKDACWQCYQPPLFYWISAKIGNLFISMGGQRGQLLKLLQFICCIYGILTVWMVYLVLSKLQLSNFSKLFAFGTVCLLPRLIYMSAINSNDAISYLFVAICIYFLIVTIEHNFSIISLALLSVAITFTLYTKYTAFVILPVVIIVFLLAFFHFPQTERKKIFIFILLATLIPVASLGVTTFNNIRTYKTPLS
jgi:4-amino-4-deoxy-L-arabinose transferase-like glycosyltransferase